MYLVHRIRVATNDAVSRALDDLGITGSQALILESLLEEGELSAAEVARRCLVSRQAIQAPLEVLERAGYVERPAPSVSARMRPCRLSEHGRALATEARTRVGALESGSTDQFDQAELEQLLRLLEKYEEFWSNATDRAATMKGARS